MVANQKDVIFPYIPQQMFFMSRIQLTLMFSYFASLFTNITQENFLKPTFEQARQKRFLIGSSSCFKASPLSKHIAEKDSAILLSISVVANLSRAHNLTKTA